MEKTRNNVLAAFVGGKYVIPEGQSLREIAIMSIRAQGLDTTDFKLVAEAEKQLESALGSWPPSLPTDKS